MTRPNTREKIVEAGLKSLLHKGFNATGVQDITSSAGVPKGSFYNHFESKEALGAEIVERYAAVAAARREILADKSKPPLERLRHHFEALNKIFVDAKFKRGCLLGNFSAELSNQSDLIRERLQELYTRWTLELEMPIREAQECGDISNRLKAPDLAAFLLDSYQGSLLRARVEQNRRPLDRFVQFTFNQILI
jgi:TetR/AcrR family transcriptional repressor of nem operon